MSRIEIGEYCIVRSHLERDVEGRQGVDGKSLGSRIKKTDVGVELNTQGSIIEELALVDQ